MSYADGAILLLNAASATSAGFPWPGGRGVFAMPAATGSGTVKLQWSPDGGTTWLDVDRSGDTYVTLTAVGAGLFELPPCTIRANVATFTVVTAYAMSVKN